MAKLRTQGYDDDAAVARTLYGALGIDPLRIDTLVKKTENGDPKKIVSERERASPGGGVGRADGAAQRQGPHPEMTS